MGSIWVAHHAGLDTEVAVKFMHSSDLHESSTALARFKREAIIAAKVRSPHAVQPIDHGVTADGVPYIVMELLHGESLERRLKRVRVLDLHSVGMLVSQICRVLSKAHEIAIVHRDIKPANLFLEDTSYELFVKLLDFGVARQSHGSCDPKLTTEGSMIGSPLYMSPEQFTDAKCVDHRTDLWALAVVVYQCLVGKTPFAGRTVVDLFMAVATRDYEPVTKVRPRLPGQFDAWFEKAFHHDIAARFQTANELSDALLAVVQGAIGGGLIGSTASIGQVSVEDTSDLPPGAHTSAPTLQPSARTLAQHVARPRRRLGALSAAAIATGVIVFAQFGFIDTSRSRATSAVSGSATSMASTIATVGVGESHVPVASTAKTASQPLDTAVTASPGTARAGVRTPKPPNHSSSAPRRQGTKSRPALVTDADKPIKSLGI